MARINSRIYDTKGLFTVVNNADVRGPGDYSGTLQNRWWHWWRGRWWTLRWRWVNDGNSVKWMNTFVSLGWNIWHPGCQWMRKWKHGVKRLKISLISLSFHTQCELYVLRVHFTDWKIEQWLLVMSVKKKVTLGLGKDLAEGVLSDRFQIMWNGTKYCKPQSCRNAIE